MPKCPYLSSSVRSRLYFPTQIRHPGEEAMATTPSKPQLLKVSEAAALLNVSEKTIRRWIEAESIPYLKLPSGSYRIPQGAPLAPPPRKHQLGPAPRPPD